MSNKNFMEVINGAVVNGSNEEVKVMMNIKEELEAKTVAMLRKEAKVSGIKGYSHMKKADLIDALVAIQENKSGSNTTSGYAINPLDDPEVEALDVSDEALLPTIEEALDQEPVLDKVRAEIMDTGAYEQEVHGKTEFLEGIDYCLNTIDKCIKETKKEEENMGNPKYDSLVKNITKMFVEQSLDTIIKDGKKVKNNFKLFYKQTKDTNRYSVMGKRLYGVVAQAIRDLYGSAVKDELMDEYIQKTLQELVNRGFLFKETVKRTYKVLDPQTMSAEEKEAFNNAFLNKDIIVGTRDDGTKKITSITKNGVELINKFYGGVETYYATTDTMNAMFKYQK